jgi:hypothetical protein
MVVVHGDSRTASGIRDSAIRIADERGLFIVSPLFDEARFPGDKFQQGGVVVNGRLVTDRDDWTVNRADDFALWGLQKMGLDASSEVLLFGHSAGGQYASRVAGFGEDDIFDRMIVANPSTHVWPSMNEKVAYGFGGGYFSSAESEAFLRDYLADPVTIYLGEDDTGTNNLASSSTAMRQGDNRLERGLNAYEAAKAEAEARGWDFGWDLVIAPNVGHSYGGMLRSPAMVEAIEAPEANNPPPPDPDPIPDPDPTPTNKTYVYTTLSQAAAAEDTIIRDYNPGDKFDFHALDADTTQSGNQDFHWIGTAMFSRNGEELKFLQDPAANITWIKGSSDHDTGAEFRLRIEGLHTFTADDFIL